MDQVLYLGMTHKHIYIYIMYMLSMYTNYSVHILNYILCVYIRVYIRFTMYKHIHANHGPR